MKWLKTEQEVMDRGKVGFYLWRSCEGSSIHVIDAPGLGNRHGEHLPIADVLAAVERLEAMEERLAAMEGWINKYCNEMDGGNGPCVEAVVAEPVSKVVPRIKNPTCPVCNVESKYSDGFCLTCGDYACNLQRKIDVGVIVLNPVPEPPTEPPLIAELRALAEAWRADAAEWAASATSSDSERERRMAISHRCRICARKLEDIIDKHTTKGETP